MGESQIRTLKSVLGQLVRGEHLSSDDSYWYINELMEGQADAVVVGAILATQQQLGLTAQEVAGAAQAMIEHACNLEIDGECTDVVGTGGDGASTVNLSTMGAVIAAGAGVKIVKHGNRAASSQCGTADVLETLGLPLDLPVQAVAQVASEVGITFAFAKTFHPAMRHVAPIRSALGIPCIFNVLGPLTNPARPQHVMVGCANRELSPIMAAVYAQRGQSGMVVTSQEGLDELVPTGPVSVWEIANGQVNACEFDPVQELGLARITLDDIRGGDPTRNAQIFSQLLAGEDIACRSAALLNAAGAIVADGHLIDTGANMTQRFKQAYALAQRSVDTGQAQALLQRWVQAAQAKRLS